MSKKRIYQIAHELDVSSKEVIAAAKKNGIKVGNHMSMFDENEEQTVKKSLGKGAKLQKAQAQPAPAKKPRAPSCKKPKPNRLQLRSPHQKQLQSRFKLKILTTTIIK